MVQRLRHFTEGVDLAHWWSFIGKGLRLQPAQQACYIYICLLLDNARFDKYYQRQKIQKMLCMLALKALCLQNKEENKRKKVKKELQLVLYSLVRCIVHIKLSCMTNNEFRKYLYLTIKVLILEPFKVSSLTYHQS